MTDKELAGYIDHTLLKPEATCRDVERLCEEARTYGFHAVCVNGRWLTAVADRLAGSGVAVVGVVDLPLGAATTKIKAAQAREAMLAGADELDMVADLGAIVEADVKYLLGQFMSVLKVCRSMTPGVVFKVIIESAALTREQKIFACQMAQQAGVDFVKTSTGLHRAGGATVEDVQLLRQSAPNCRVKAAGGIRTVEQALALIDAGAQRIGTSCGVEIVEQFRAGYSQ